MQDRRYSWLVSLCLAALFAFPHAAFRYRASIRLLVDFDIMVEACGLKPPVLQVYYDQGRGFSEKNSVRVVLPEQQSKHIQAYLPVTRLYRLRLDYLNGPGTVRLSRMTVTDPFGPVLLSEIPVRQFVGHQTQQIVQDGNALRVQSEANADDPHLALNFEPPLRASGAGKFWSSLVFGCKVFGIMAAALEILFLCIGKSFLNARLGIGKAKAGK